MYLRIARIIRDKGDQDSHNIDFDQTTTELIPVHVKIILHRHYYVN